MVRCHPCIKSHRVDVIGTRWQYVKEHDVPLPDEYDQIYHDLEPYWGIEPADLLDIRSELESKIDSYTLGKTSTSGISVVNTSFEAGKYNQLIKGSETIVDLLEDVREFLPPFRAVFSPHDGPNRLSDYAVKSATLKAAATRKCKPLTCRSADTNYEFAS